MSQLIHSKTILVIDDDETLLKLFSSALSIKGFKTVVANNGCEGLTALCEQSVDMVITDWKMPNMNGLKLLCNIREKEHLRNLPVLLISASELPAAVNRAYELGACGWLKKPFKFNALVNIINETLTQH
jgi:CheY-like chemotaxis protein